MLSSRQEKMLAGLDSLRELHNQVFNEPYTTEEGKAIANWSIAWPEEYRVMRNILMQFKILGDTETDA